MQRIPILPFLLVLSGAIPSASTESTLTGIVKDEQGAPLEGVGVKLATGGDSTSSVGGHWSLGGLTSVSPRASFGPIGTSGRLELVGGRLRISVEGRSILGRERSSKSIAPSIVPPPPGRTAFSPEDTLVFTFQGRTLAKRPIQGLNPTGILQVVDTSADPAHGVPWVTNPTYRTIQDSRDGQTYRTVKVGRQTWIAENLNFSTDSSVIYPTVPSSGALYGRLYTWAGAMALPDTCNWRACPVSVPTRGLCPEGFHVPDTTEWRILEATVMESTSTNSDNVGTVLRSREGWFGPEGTARPGSDSVGLRILPAGNRYDDGIFNHAGERTFLHSATAQDASTVWARQITLDWSGVVSEYYYGKSHSLSLRCIADLTD